MDGTITVALKSYPSMIDVAFNLDSRIETLPEAIVLFTVNSRFRLSPAFAYTGFELLAVYGSYGNGQVQSYDLDAVVKI